MEITLGVPQALYLALCVVTVVYEAARHGKERIGKHNAYASLALWAIEIAILTWGGFF